MLGWSKVKSLQCENPNTAPCIHPLELHFQWKSHFQKKSHSITFSLIWNCVFVSNSIWRLNYIAPCDAFPLYPSFPNILNWIYIFCTSFLQVIQVPNIDTADLWFVYLIILKCLFFVPFTSNIFTSPHLLDNHTFT